MALNITNIPDTIRTPGVHAEIDESRALKGLVQNPHKALILGGAVDDGAGAVVGEKDYWTLQAITRDNMAEGYFGNGSEIARMCNFFKDNNPNTELYAIACSGGTAKASAALNISVALSANGGGDAQGGSAIGAGTYYLMINGQDVNIPLTSLWSTKDCNSAIEAAVNADSTLPCVATTNAASALLLQAVCSGTNGNNLDVRDNYYDWQSMPAAFSGGDSVVITGFADGAGVTDFDDAWAIIDDERFHYIIHSQTDAANLTSIEDELSDRFGPLTGLQGQGFTSNRGTAGTCETLGEGRNSPHNTILGMDDGPTDPAEIAAALGAKAAKHLNSDPARPLHFIKLKGVLPPPVASRFTRAERDVLLYDGIATYKVDDGGNVMIERCITTYQTNALGITDPSYLDVNTLATLGEIRDQWVARMSNRFLAPRFKLADDGFPVQPGTYIATPGTVKQETIALFTQLRDKGYIENLDNFIENLVVERDLTDRNRVNVLLPPDLINQFRVLAGLIQFIL